MSRKAVRRLRSEREFCERDAARWSSRAIPEPPSRKEMTVSSCSIPSIRGSDAAPTREGSSPSSFANVLGHQDKNLSLTSPQAMFENILTRHSLRVSTIRSPRTNPQLPQTRSPLPNSSTIFGFGSLHSGQMRRTAKSGPKDGCCLFSFGTARGNGCEYAILEGSDKAATLLCQPAATTFILRCLFGLPFEAVTKQRLYYVSHPALIWSPSSSTRFKRLHYAI